MPLEETMNTNNFVVGAAYTRNEVADAGEVNRPSSPRDWTGIVQFKNCVLLFVTLDKANFDQLNALVRFHGHGASLVTHLPKMVAYVYGA